MKTSRSVTGADFWEEKIKTTATERASEDRGAEQQDPGEKSTNVAQREIDRGLYAVDKRRSNDIERAIERMAEGTYGLSDFSGKPIPMARLEATPETILTVQIEEWRENKECPMNARPHIAARPAN